MTTNTTIGYGATFARDAGGATFADIAEVVSITPPQLSRDAPDATHLGSPNGYREFIGGLRDAGEVSIELNYVPGDATQDLLRTDFDDDDAGTYQITFPDTSTVTFSAFITGLSPSVPLDDKMALSATFKVTGQPTWA